MVAVPSEALVAAVAPDLFGPSILATAERLNTARLEQRKKERQHKIGEDGLPELVSDVMEKSLMVTARLLLQITGIADLRQARAAHLLQFRGALQRLPSVPPRDVGRAVGGYPGCGSNHAGIAPDKPQMIAL